MGKKGRLWALFGVGSNKKGIDVSRVSGNVLKNVIVLEECAYLGPGTAINYTQEVNPRTSLGSHV